MELKDKVQEMLEQAKFIPNQDLKKDNGKPRFSLVPQEPLWEVIDVLEFGATKYEPYSWKELNSYEDRVRCMDAIQRHLRKYNKGIMLDEETGASHLAHAMCNLLFLLYFEQEDRVSANL